MSLLLSIYCVLWFACGVQQSCSLSQWQPDAFRSPAELAHSKGYPVEEHVTVTEDGYVLSLQRVPRGFLLADAGYDVWLGNYRGTPFSRGHLEFSDRDSRYWDFGLGIWPRLEERRAVVEGRHSSLLERTLVVTREDLLLVQQVRQSRFCLQETGSSSPCPDSSLQSRGGTLS
ncbi:hypothetical protein HPB49_007832 [Dermacentor silvarum]|uniref:Uncharacterized protein n=1 Tax=Dermacentor silvarum TaxID=543639 RepID=A0ACB8C2L3_DERSI|nr:hypothetical protein HPB49_007832 [Dermacentor silvarum]